MLPAHGLLRELQGEPASAFATRCCLHVVENGLQFGFFGVRQRGLDDLATSALQFFEDLVGSCLADEDKKYRTVIP
jgi:hypothetical protein